MLAFCALVVASGCGLIRGALGLAVPLAATKLTLSCLPEGTRIDTPDGARPVEEVRAGDIVIGFDGEHVRVLQAHAYAESDETEFLTVSFEGGATVELCRMHRIAGVRAKCLKPGATVDGRRVEKLTTRRGVLRSYDLLTEDDGYRISGVPVNSMIEEMYETGRTGITRD